MVATRGQFSEAGSQTFTLDAFQVQSLLSFPLRCSFFALISLEWVRRTWKRVFLPLWTLSLDLRSCLSPTNDQIKEREGDSVTRSVARSPLINQTKDIKSLSTPSLCLCNLGSLVGSPPFPFSFFLSCWCMTHVTVIKQPRYYCNASCGDVIGGCHNFWECRHDAVGNPADLWGNCSH